MRPPSQGPEAITQDIMRLTRVLRRVQCDPKRTDEQKEKITGLINEAISLLPKRGDGLVGGESGVARKRSSGRKSAKV